jgi:SOS-response transcriptional repressor LexA
MIAPTDRQNQILDFVKNYLLTNHTAPTYAQIGISLGITSRAGVHGHIRRMEKKRLLVLPAMPSKRVGFFEVITG